MEETKKNTIAETHEKKTFNCPFEIKNIDSTNEEFYVLEGYASTFGNIDLGDDIVEKGAFAKSIIKNPSVPVLSGHDMQEKIGDTTRMKEDEVGLFVEIILPKDDTFVTGRIMPQMKSSKIAGRLQEMSIGFRIIDSSRETREGKQVRLLNEVDLFEISLVSKAMNPQAKVTDFKKDSSSDEDLNQEEKSEDINFEYKSVDEVPAEIKAIEKFLKFKGLSSNESKAIISRIKDTMKQREVADQVVVREEQTSALISELKNLTNYLKGNK